MKKQTEMKHEQDLLIKEMRYLTSIRDMLSHKPRGYAVRAQVHNGSQWVTMPHQLTLNTTIRNVWEEQLENRINFILMKISDAAFDRAFEKSNDKKSESDGKEIH
jgi:hypothetical protein